MSGTNEHQGTVSTNLFMVSERDLATRWDISRRTLQRWRAQRRGPPWVLLGGTVRYRVSDILKYEDRMQHGDRTA